MDYNIKIYVTIIKLIRNWTTFMKIIDHVIISCYPTYHIFGKFPTDCVTKRL